MSTPDDRHWKAEDMLQCVAEAKEEGSGSSRQCIERFFDRIDTPASELPTMVFGLEADRAAPMEPPRADAAPGPMPLPTEPPVEVPNHEFIRCLGAGGFGQVWLTRHTLTEHYRACKLIPADKALELDGLKRLKQKVPGHPNLFPIEEVGDAEGWLYCLMPLADNASTDHPVLDTSGYEPLTLDLHLRRNGRRPSEEAADIATRIANGLTHLHAHGVTHGDIKPANIIRLGGSWRVADYGLVRDLNAPSGGAHTPGYVPPEGPGSTKADQFALGVVLMELLTNRPATMLGDFRSTSIERFGLDASAPKLAEVILRATAADPDERFGSVGEFIEALRPLTHDEQRRPPRSRSWMWAAFVLLATAATIAGVLLHNAMNRSEPVRPHSLAADAPISIESFEVRHYRYDPATNTTVAVGPINADNPAAREGDDVTLHARLSREGYVYLLSLDADGRVRPRIPASPTEPPAKATRIDYPSLPAGTPDDILYNLSRGPGTHGFMLLTTDQPLPPWSDWIASHGEPSWTRESLPPSGVFLFDGRETTYASATRDPMPRRGQLVLDPIDWAKAQDNLAAAFIAFTVLPSEED